MTVVEISLSFIPIYNYGGCTLLHLPFIILGVHLLDAILIFGAYGVEGVKYVWQGDGIQEMWIRLINQATNVVLLREFATS